MMRFEHFVARPSGWVTISASRHLQVQAARLYSLLYDIASWGLREDVRLLSKVEGKSVQYGFADRTRATLEIVQKPFGILRLDLSHEGLQTEAAATNREIFWQDLTDAIAKRLLCEPLTVVSAPGKINLFFKVGRLKRDGYHEVASVYQAVNLREEIVVDSWPEWRVGVTGNLSADHLSAVPTGEDNLVVRAAKALAEAAGIEKVSPVSIAIEKVVPVAGGMAGGSADAAAAIVAVNELWGCKLSQAKLMKVASGIGADVPFSLMGGTAIGLGRGERLEAIEKVPTLHWVLLPDAMGLNTPAVYQRLDELRAARGEDPRKVAEPEVAAKLITALKKGDPAKIAPLLRNDLQEAALSLRSDLQRTLDFALDCGALTAIISGSGPTIALLAMDAADAAAIASRMRVLVSDAIATSGPAFGTQLEA